MGSCVITLFTGVLKRRPSTHETIVAEFPNQVKLYLLAQHVVIRNHIISSRGASEPSKCVMMPLMVVCRGAREQDVVVHDLYTHSEHQAKY